MKDLIRISDILIEYFDKKKKMENIIIRSDNLLEKCFFFF